MGSMDVNQAAQGLRQLAALFRAAVEPMLQAAGQTAISSPPPYGAAIPPEAGAIPASDLLSPVYPTGNGGALDIAVVYDWILSPFVSHCHAPDGQDCPTFAAEGPYTALTLPAHPRDGVT